MLPFRHLIDNRDLALRLLAHWVHDAARLTILDQFRISANAVYPFFRNDRVCFLRFAPTTEKKPDLVRGELDFLDHLRDKGYPVPNIIPAIDGREIVTDKTPWGEFLAVVFEGVPGTRIDRSDFNDELCRGYGRALAELHRSCRGYCSENRPDWRDALDWVNAILHDCNAPAEAKRESAAIRARLSELPAGDDDFALIHYDFEPDNVFHDAGRFHAIDFDDCMRHWFAMDVDQAVDGLREEAGDERAVTAEACFLEGYRSVRTLTLWDQRSWFRRFANLYTYARCMYSSYERLENEPEWMVGLRAYLGEKMERNRAGFSG
jgi:Ser/Thr protein kinase RdoA (MazF antagonist)